MPFTCSICEEESTHICARCTKDACDNHLCEKCLRCSDCCECELRLDKAPRLAPTASLRATLPAPEPNVEPEPSLRATLPAPEPDVEPEPEIPLEA